jgi:hypothetical protein
MASVYSENLRVYNAIQFKQSLVDPDPTNIYLTFGRATPWPNDAAPPQANSSITTYNDIWSNMIGAKLISGNDVRHAIPRYDWSANTSYIAYDHRITDLFLPNTKFYVLTTDWNVYKCLSNNNSSISTVMPTQTQTNTPIEESDGYIWKYMYTLSEEERLRFMTDQYIPVQTLTLNNNRLQWLVQEDAISGSIDAIIITDTGINYTNTSNIIVTISGDGDGAEAIARLNTQSNTVSSIVMVDRGSGYTYANVAITGGGGSDATGVAVISPVGGHGSDPLRELGGSYLIINPRVRGTEDNVLPATNEFRHIALIQDPKLYSTSNIATGRVYSQVLTLTVSSGFDDYQQDEIVYQGGSLALASFKGTVVKWDAGNNQVKLINTVGTPLSDVLTGNTSATSRVVESVTNKDLLDYSGYLLYVDYIQPITRSIDQTEDYKIVLNF